MDDLLALFEADTKREAQASLRDNGNSENRNHSQQLRDIETGSQSNHATVDPFTKIRIISRLISRSELVDLFAPFQFQSSVALASMNHRDLASLVVSPSSSSQDHRESSFTGGKTNMVTMGILFHNSGTKITSKGAAFSILSIGELHTGPAVSVLLFGEAYSAFTTKVSVGQVVCVLGSTILPPRPGSGDTRITLSIRDMAQLRIVGTAQDYGRCSGMDTKKINGILEEVRCIKHVDLRISRYCKCHSQFGTKKNYSNDHSSHNGIERNAKKKQSFIESLRAQSTLIAPALKQGQLLPLNNMTRSVIEANPNDPGRTRAAKDALLVSKLMSVKTTNNSLQNPNSNSTVNSNRNNTNCSTLLTAQHFLSSSHKAITNYHVDLSNKVTPTSSSLERHVSNPYSVNRKMDTATILSLSKRDYVDSNVDVLGTALQKKRSRGEIYSPQEQSVSHRSIDTDITPDVDSHVRTKSKMKSDPNSLLQQNTSRVVFPAQPFFSVAVTPSPNSDKTTEMILERQRKLSEMIRKKQLLEGNRSEKGTTDKIPTDTLDFLTGRSLSDADKARILDTKSRYKSEAEAEIYVKNRMKITELEKQEENMDKREAASKKKASSDRAIETKWRCRTCQQIYYSRPRTCVKLKHQLEMSREIKKAVVGTDEMRLKVSKTSSEDGGLILGTGLNWSGWMRVEDDD